MKSSSPKKLALGRRLPLAPQGVDPVEQLLLFVRSAPAILDAVGRILRNPSEPLAAPLLERQAGDPRSANSAAPQGCVGQGMGNMPMSRHARPVPSAEPAAASSPAQGIVTRTGQDLQGLGGAAIEPGPEGMRPAAVAACWGACGVCDCAAAAARPEGAPLAGAVAGRQRGEAQSIPDGNHGDNNKTTVTGERS